MDMRYTVLLLTLVSSTGFLVHSGCSSTEGKTPEPEKLVRTADSIPAEEDEATAKYYREHQGNEKPSLCRGNEGSGSLEHAKLLPFSGKNYRYFDRSSYLGGRAFMSDGLRDILSGSFRELEQTCPGRNFLYMECSREQGGRIPPHRTHQNGRSVDLGVPLVSRGKPYYKADSLGAAHYLLDFDDKGRLKTDSSIHIDFEVLGRELLSLDKQARQQGLQIKKVILRLELKDDLFATESGKEVKKRRIYFASTLTPAINALHDDHFHVDFEPLKK